MIIPLTPIKKSALADWLWPTSLEEFLFRMFEPWVCSLHCESAETKGTPTEWWHWHLALCLITPWPLYLFAHFPTKLCAELSSFLPFSVPASLQEAMDLVPTYTPASPSPPSLLPMFQFWCCCHRELGSWRWVRHFLSGHISFPLPVWFSLFFCSHSPGPYYLHTLSLT